MEARAKFLKDKIEEYRFAHVDEALFAYFDEYEEICRANKDYEELFYLSYCKGEAFYRLGDFEKAEIILNECIVNSNPMDTSLILLAMCHNLLGLINTSMGQEVLALENYLIAIDYAEINGDHRQKLVSELNIAWLYRDLRDYEKSFMYCEDAISEIDKEEGSSAYNIAISCYSYVGQLYCKTGDYEKAIEMVNLIKTLPNPQETFFYDTTAQNLLIRTSYYLGDEEEALKHIDGAIKAAPCEDDFLEFSESLFDICEFILDHNKEKSWELIEALHYNVDKLPIYFLKMKLKRLEVLYHQKYSDEQTFLKACGDYFIMQEHYSKDIKSSKRFGLHRLELLKSVQQEKELYFEQSKQDMMTGLLNKVTFENQVEKLLSSHVNIANSHQSFMIFDLDNFKGVNDTMGHMKGDKIIISITECLNKVFAHEGLIGRVGGDEFAVFYPKDATVKSIKEKAKKVQQLFAKQQDVKDAIANGINLSVSIGVMFVSDENTTYQDCFQRADAQLYKAKALGKNAVCTE